MGLLKFDTDHLAQFDNGLLKTAVDRTLQTIIADCRDRGALVKARKLTLEIGFTPEPDGTGDVDRINVTYDVKAKIPALSRKHLQIGVRKNNMAVFSQDADEPADVGGE